MLIVIILSCLVTTYFYSDLRDLKFDDVLIASWLLNSDEFERSSITFSHLPNEVPIILLLGDFIKPCQKWHFTQMWPSFSVPNPPYFDGKLFIQIWPSFSVPNPPYIDGMSMA